MWPFKKRDDIEFFLDLDLIEESFKDTALKQLAIHTIIGMISRTIIQSEFRIKKDNQYIRDEAYYRFNVKPNVNQSASAFWTDVTSKLIYDGACLVVMNDDNDLLVADDYTKNEYAIYGDTFKDVVVKDYQFKRTFNRDEVLYFEYGNEKLSRLIDSLFYDYGKLLRRLFDYQMRKNQIRATVDIETIMSKDEESLKRLQSFIDKTYEAIKTKDIAIIPQQKGLSYNEKNDQKNVGQSVEEIDKVTNGYLFQVANAVGIPISMLKGDLADVEGSTRNYMKFCIDPILTSIEKELNRQFISKANFLNGDRIDIKRVGYRDIFDVANAVDKVRASGVLTGNELREELGYERADDPMLDKFFITKNYQESSQALDGGSEE